MKRFLTRPAFPVGVATLLAAFISQGCGTGLFKSDSAPGEATSFQSNVTADPVPVPAEIVSDLSGIPGQADMPKKSGKQSLKKSAAATSELDEVEEADDGMGATNHGPKGKGLRTLNVNYVVKREDTLMKISFAAFGNVYRWREIYEANRAKISNPNALVKGTILRINGAGVTISKNGKPYFIHRRDTLVKISDHLYGTPKHWKKIWHNNPELIHDPNKIYAGFSLYYTWTESERIEAENLKAQKPFTPTVKERKPASSEKPIPGPFKVPAAKP